MNVCGLSVTYARNVQHFNSCAGILSYAYDTHLDKSYTWWNDRPLGEHPSGFWAETLFDSQQAFNKRLSVGWLALPKPKTGNDPTDIQNSVIVFQDGESPVRIRVPIERLLNITFNGQKICAEYKCPLGAGHYASTLNETVADAAVILQQPYTDYLTVFQNAPLPVEFSALPRSRA